MTPRRTSVKQRTVMNDQEPHPERSVVSRARPARRTRWAGPGWVGTARALRLEIRHSAAIWVLPVLAVLCYVAAYRRAVEYPPTWTLRASVLTGPGLVFFSAIAAGIAAWAATREGRRKTGDLLATTADA